MRLQHAAISVGIGLLFLLASMVWFRWNTTKLTQPEIDTYLEQIAAQTQVPGGRHDMANLRTFMENDDGKPFFVVNLYRFHDTADYAPNTGHSGSGEDAFQRFTNVMVGLILSRGSYPMFSSNQADAYSDWDRVAIVRYRSRRDLMNIYLTDAFADASQHKWAAIKDHNRMVVSARNIPGIEPVLIILSVSLAMAVFVGFGLVSRPTRLG